MKLEGKVALVPGGTMGIGAEIALAYAKEGATVVVSSRKQENVDAMVERLNEVGKGDGVACDIADPAAVKQMVEEVHAKYGRIDVMLNSAGIFPNTPFLEASVEETRRVVDVDLLGPFFCAQEAAKYMAEQGAGSIIFITSGQALRGVPLMAHYSAAKAGLVGLTRALAAELGIHGIRVNAIACGLTLTDKVAGQFNDAMKNRVAGKAPLKRIGEPGDYNGLAVLLASDEGSFITGDTIAVDGGVSEADAVQG